MEGTAAWRDLLAKNPALAEAFARTQADYGRRFSQLEAKLGEVPEIQRCLDQLERAGADRNRVLHVLAIELSFSQKTKKPRLTRRRRWLRGLRTHKDSLRRLAERIRDLADEVERTYGRLETYPYLLGIALQIVNDCDVGMVSDLRAEDLAAEMRACADDLEAKARELGRVSKDISPAMTRRPVEELLAYLHRATGGVRPHLGTICEMLNAAYREQGLHSRRELTTDGLEKLFERHVRPRLK